MTAPVALDDRRAEDARLHSPSAARNTAPIAAALGALIAPGARALEVGAGTGEHAVALTEALDAACWRPSDPDPASRASIDAWAAARGLQSRIAPAVDLSVTAPGWWRVAQSPVDLVLSINMIHIAPWAATLGLLDGAAALLAPGPRPGRLVLYGPLAVDGRHTAPSNAAFDESLKSRDPAWGVRDLTDVEREAEARSLRRVRTIGMPANNLVVMFVRD